MQPTRIVRSRGPGSVTDRAAERDLVRVPVEHDPGVVLGATAEIAAVSSAVKTVPHGMHGEAKNSTRQPRAIRGHRAEVEPPRRIERREHLHAARQAHPLRHPAVGRVGQQHAVARVDQRQQRVQQRLARPARDDDLALGVVGDAPIGRVAAAIA